MVETFNTNCQECKQETAHWITKTRVGIPLVYCLTCGHVLKLQDPRTVK